MYVHMSYICIYYDYVLYMYVVSHAHVNIPGDAGFITVAGSNSHKRVNEQ